MAAKRVASRELNHDNWNEEDEPEEAGTFKQADTETLQGRVIKKAKRRGIQSQDGPSIFAGFGGFKSAASTDKETSVKSGAGAFDFLAGAKNGSSTDSPAKNAAFSFKSPPPSNTFTFSGTPASTENGKQSAEKPAASAGLFAFGSANAKPAFGSFGSPATEEKATFSFAKTESKPEDEKSNGSKKDESTAQVGTDNAGPTDAKSTTPLASLPPLKAAVSSKWSCPICMVPNDADKDQCVCCSEPKPGSKPKASATPAFGSSAANPAFASVTTSGFKFGASDSNSSNNSAAPFKFGSGPATSSTTDSSAKPTGFTFGSTEKSTKPAEPESKPKTSEVSETSSGTSNNSEKKYSREFLSHLKALNNQVTDWIKKHIDKNPYVFLSPVFKDYEKHLKDLESKYPYTTTSSPPSATSTLASAAPTTSSAPLLGAVFGSPASKPTEEVKFGTSSGFAFDTGSTSADKSGSKSEEVKKDDSGIFSAPKTSELEKVPSTGFSFGTSTTDKKESFSFGTKSDSKASDSSSPFTFGSTPKTDDKKSSSGFSFGGSTADTNKPASTFPTFGSSDKSSTGFSFGSTSNNAGDSTKSGFSFGSSTASSGFSFGSVAPPAASTEAKTDEAGDEEDEPPKVEVNQVKEDDAFHSVRCKLFYKKDKEFVEKGLGMLHLKKVEGGKTQLLVRAETNLGNILLNIFINDKMNVVKRKNNLQFGCIPNPPIKGVPEGPVIMLVKVKDALMADQLEEKIKEAMDS